MKSVRRLFAKGTFPCPELFDGLSSELCRWYLSQRPGKGTSISRSDELRYAVTWVLTALYDAYGHGLTRTILPLGKSNFEGFRFGYRVTKTALKILTDSEFVRLIVARPGLGEASATEVEATGRLRRRFERDGYVWSRRSYDESREVIVLREKDDFLCEKQTLPTPEIPLVIKMRTEVHEINRSLLNWTVFPRLPDHILRRMMFGQEGVQLNFSAVTYRRIFANGRLDYGGRFYGPWWQQLPRGFRPYICINGDPTVELDYGGMALSLLYTSKGKEPPSEPYDLSPEIPFNEVNRAIVKRYINALLNATGSYWLGKDEYFLLGVSRSRLAKLVAQKHPLVEDALGTEIGLHLQYLDSEIAARVMLELFARKIPVLCIHDSFITPQSSLMPLREVMLRVFREFTGAAPVIKQVITGDRMIAGKYHIYDRFISSSARVATDDHPRSSSLVGSRKMASDLEERRAVEYPVCV